jgi:L-ribulokinase
MPYSLGLDYGTSSVRALLVNTQTGEEIAAASFNYPHGTDGVVIDPKDPHLARQQPADYLEGAKVTIREVLKAAAKIGGFAPDQIIGIGVDTTGSTPIPVDAKGTPLAMNPALAGDPAALAWLWKDHTGYAEAEEITAAAARLRPQFLAKCGGRYSSEWFWSKILRCSRVSPKVFAAAATWVECADWIPAALTNTTGPAQLKRCICAAGHKAMFHTDWHGYPDAAFLSELSPALARIRASLPDQAYSAADCVGGLSAEIAAQVGLPAGLPVAAGAFDAHLGAVGSGIGKGVLVKIIGTSTCDMMVAPLAQKLPDIPGLCGIVPGSILPGYFGLEAGQSAVGDIFNWFVSTMKPQGATHESLSAAAAALAPGESGLLSLDWHNGNRTILVDQRLTGLIVGLSLHSSPAEIYRALIEATAFGARIIMERLEEYGCKVDRVVNGGGISAKNPLAMQIYADVMNRPVGIAKSAQNCALGAAIAGAVAAKKKGRGYDDFDQAVAVMVAPPERIYTPIPGNVAIYNRLHGLYRQLHDAFGLPNHSAPLGNIMKDLLTIRDAARA